MALRPNWKDYLKLSLFAVIRETMRKENMVGLARVVIYPREHLLLLAPRGKGLVATALRYKSEIRNETNYFEEIIESIKVPADMLKLAAQIIESKRCRSRTIRSITRKLRARSPQASTAATP